MLKRLGPMVLMFVLIGGGVVGGTAIGLGPAGVLAGLIALFTLMASSGGPLRSDLRLMAWFGPAMVAATAGSRLLAEVSQPAAIALVTLIVGIAGLLPVWGSRYASVGMGLGFATVFAYGMQLTQAATNLQVVGASVVAVAAVTILRVLTGISDPSKPTRARIAALLDADAPGRPDVGAALRTWAGDRPERWSGLVLAAAHRYRLTVAALTSARAQLTTEQAAHVDDVLAATRADADALADAVLAKAAAEAPARGTRPDPVALPDGVEQLLRELDESLDTVRTAVAERGPALIDVPRGLRRQVVAIAARGELSWRSAQLRHALRCAVGILAALVVAAQLRHGDPLTVTFLMTVMGILQISWQVTLTKARQRILGAVAGAVVLAVLLLVVPTAALPIVAGASMLVGFWFMQSQPTIFNAAMVMVAVGMNVSTRHLEPVPTLVEYLVLTVVAVAIGLLFGFAVVPGVRTPPATQRLTEAIEATRTLFTRIADEKRTRPAVIAAARDAMRAQQDLALPPAPAEPAQAAALEDAIGALQGITAAANLVAVRPESRSATATFAASVAAALSGRDAAVEQAGAPAGEEEQILEAAVASDVARLQEARRVLSA